MAITSILLLNYTPLPFSPQSQTSSSYQVRTRMKKTGPSNLSISAGNFQREDIVIVGAGIAGLATAVSLNRLGIRTVVLEQADSLRTSGTSLTLFKNGWSVLDSIGVGSELRNQYLELQGMVVKSIEGKELRSFTFKDEDPSQEVRAVERRVLLETLANQLPPNTIRFSSGLKNIERDGSSDDTLLELSDGTKLLAQIAIGCDGIRSRVAKWMGFSEPRYVGQCAFRGLGFYPKGHGFAPKVNNFYGQGIRVGVVPVSLTSVYWFICFNIPTPGPKITDPTMLKQQARDLVKNWPSELLNIVDHTLDETITKTPLVDRWLWPTFTPSVFLGRTVLVGDAWHPMTPNLGQGACCALEDAVVLSKKLACALESGPMAVEAALQSYGSERWRRIFPLSIKSNFVGSLLQWDNSSVCWVRDNVIVPKVVRLGPMLEHTNYLCEPLQSNLVDSKV